MQDVFKQEGRFKTEIKGHFRIREIDSRNGEIDLIPDSNGEFGVFPCITMSFTGELFDLKVGDVVYVTADIKMRHWDTVPDDLKKILKDKFNEFKKVFPDLPSITDIDGNIIDHYMIDQIKWICR